jgi:hypothetical protein
MGRIDLVENRDELGGSGENGKETMRGGKFLE